MIIFIIFSFVIFYKAVESAAKFDFSTFGSHRKTGKYRMQGTENRVFDIVSCENCVVSRWFTVLLYF